MFCFVLFSQNLEITVNMAFTVNIPLHSNQMANKETKQGEIIHKMRDNLAYYYKTYYIIN